MSGNGLDVLFGPIKLGQRECRNRVWLAPMSVCYADTDGFVTTGEIEHYGRRAQGGAGMVITENFAVSPAGRQLPRQTNAWHERHLPGLSLLAAEIKRHGALAIMQIVHAGRYAGPWQDYEAHPGLAPSAVAFPLQPGRVVTPLEIAIPQIEEAIEDFARAAALAEQAGFDGVEIHGAQGFLISQFLSPRMNLRQDGWGGDGEGRMRFALAVLQAVRARVSAGFLVGWHMLSDELAPGGYAAADAVALAPRLAEGGADFLIPVAGTFEAFQLEQNQGLMWRPQFQLDAARQVAKAATIPVIANGNLGAAEQMATLINDDAFAAVALARPMLTDPDWVTKQRTGRAAEIRSCGCMPPQCLQTQLKGVTCRAWPAEVQLDGYLGYDA